MWSFKRDIYRTENVIDSVVSYQYLTNASSSNGFATQSPACSGTTIYPIWTNVTPISNITSGTTLYSDVNLTSPWLGQLEWYGIGSTYGGIPISGFQIDNSGDVILINTCPECYNYTIKGQAGLLPGERNVNYTSCDGTPSSIAASTTQIYTICAQRNSVIPEYPEAPIVITRTTLCN